MFATTTRGAHVRMVFGSAIVVFTSQGCSFRPRRGDDALRPVPQRTVPHRATESDLAALRRNRILAGASCPGRYLRLFLAPLQFSERLRKRYTTAHHIVGRVYVIGRWCCAAWRYGQYLAEGRGGPREFTTLATVDAAMLMTTTLVAYLFAIRRRITQHRQWMTRSYAVALIFFEGRLLGGLLGIDDNVNATMAAIWACLRCRWYSLNSPTVSTISG